MLAIKRSRGESIIIELPGEVVGGRGTRIEIRIVDWTKNKCRVLVQAPKELKIDRTEIWRQNNPNQKTPLEIVDELACNRSK